MITYQDFLLIKKEKSIGLLEFLNLHETFLDHKACQEPVVSYTQSSDRDHLNVA